VATDSRHKISTRADEQEGIDVDELLAASKRLIDKMTMLIENAQKVINQRLDAKNRSEQLAGRRTREST
jgi:hypothetical protein